MATNSPRSRVQRLQQRDRTSPSSIPDRAARPIIDAPDITPTVVRSSVPLNISGRPERAEQLVPTRSSAENSLHRPAISNNNSNVNQVSGSGNTLINNNPVTIHYVIYGPIPSESDAIQIKITTDLETRFVPQAVYDAQLSSGCMEGTRVEILRNVISWIKDPDGQSIFWLTGWAGTGKSAIAWTVCSRASDDPEIVLGGSFFCSRSASQVLQRDVRCVIPTLAQLLARQSSTFSQALADELARDPDVVQKHVPVQIEKLLTRPLLALANSPVPVVFVIDALDECGEQPTDGGVDEGRTRRFVTEMLEALVAFSKNKVKLPVKFFVTSRPETHIRDTSVSDAEFSQVLRLHTVVEEQVAADIRRYIAAKLLGSSRLQAQFTDGDVDRLTRLSDGLFIFAATALQYTLGDGVDFAMRRFKTVLNASKDSSTSGATGPLDHMYALILKDAAKADEFGTDDTPTMLKLLAALLSARMTLSIAALAELLNLEKYDVRATLSRLHSVIHVPDDNTESGVRALHASFGDYLFSRAPNHLRISQSLGHEAPAHGCFRVMSECLHFNISHSRSSYEPNGVARPDSITPSVEYACTQWAYHVANLPQIPELEQLIYDVLRRQFMFWLEVMSVLGQVQRATAMLLQVVKAVKSPELVRFLRDANLFVASSQAAIELSAPHIYLSALPFADKDSLIYRTYAPLYTGLIFISLFGIKPHSGRHILTLRGHEGGVTSLCYSADGLLLVSGSRDGTVRVWDPFTGEETMSPLLSGTAQVTCVALAPNGRHVAAGTETGAVYMWHIQVGGSIQPQRLPGSWNGTICVAFSLDSGLVASLFSSKTVCVCRVDTGQELARLDCRIDQPSTVSFSWNGEVTVSGPSVWRIGIGNIGSSVARFSPNGKFVVSLEGRSVSLWTQGDTDHRSYVSLDGHTEEVFSAVFSPNSLYIASASDDGTIRIWSTEGSEVAVESMSTARWERHRMCISSRGVYVASVNHRLGTYGSNWSANVWNGRTGEQFRSPPENCIRRLQSIAISSDGRLVATGSHEGLIQLWDTSTGQAVGQPLRGHTWPVSCLVFTPDTRWLASASTLHRRSLTNSGPPDSSLRVWDVVQEQESILGRIHIHPDTAAVAISSDCHFIAALGTRSGFQLWECQGVETRLRLRGEDGGDCVEFSPDAGRVMTAGKACDSCVWNVSTGELIFRLEGCLARVIAYSPDGRLIATVSGVNAVRLWDAETGVLYGVLQGHINQRWMVLGPPPADSDIAALSRQDDQVELLGFTADGASIASVSSAWFASVWDVSAAHSLHLRSPSGIYSLASATLEDGWLKGSLGELLVWVPAAYRPHLQLPPCIQRSGIETVHILVSSEGWHRGETWTSCWRGDAPDAVANTV